MESSGAAMLIMTKLKGQYKQLEDARGELAEVLKAEAAARVDGMTYSQETTITGRRKDGDINSLEFTKESIDLKAKVDSHVAWIQFYSLLITSGIYIDVNDCP